MPNLYITPQEIKDTAPDIIQASTTKYDDALLRLCDNVSRFIDRFCKRQFYPRSEARYFDGSGQADLAIDDVISVSQVDYSEDDGENYTQLTESGNWLLRRGKDYNHPGSYDLLVVNKNCTAISAWDLGQRSIKITGVWAFADDRDLAWEDSQDEVEDDPLASGATTLTVNDVDGASQYGIMPRFHAGQLLRIESEYLEITATDPDAETTTVLRGRNGTTAAQHAQNTQIDIWRPPEPIKQAAGIMAVRALERALQGYGDTRASPELGTLLYLRNIDPEARELMKLYERPHKR